jgi:hypothetical protein
MVLGGNHKSRGPRIFWCDASNPKSVDRLAGVVPCCVVESAASASKTQWLAAAFIQIPIHHIIGYISSRRLHTTIIHTTTIMDTTGGGGGAAQQGGEQLEDDAGPVFISEEDILEVYDVNEGASFFSACVGRVG